MHPVWTSQVERPVRVNAPVVIQPKKAVKAVKATTHTEPVENLVLVH